MSIIIIIVGLFLIFWKEANKNVVTPKQRQEVMKYKPLVDEQKRLHDSLWNGEIFKKK